MLKKKTNQVSFVNIDYTCYRLIPQNTFSRKSRELITPLMPDKSFADMYCSNNAKPAELIKYDRLLSYYPDTGNPFFKRTFPAVSVMAYHIYPE